MKYEIKAEQLDKIIAKQKELIELLARYFVVRTRPSLDELIRSAELKIELAELEQESKEHSEKLGEKVQPSVENCGITCNGPDCEGCSDFIEKPNYCTCGNPSGEGNCHFEDDEKLIYECADCGKLKDENKEQQPNNEAEEILENELNNIGFSFNEQLKPDGISIAQIRKVKKAVLKAMQEYAQQSSKEDEIIKTLTEFSQQSRKNEINDILKCISKFDDTENLENKGRYFEVIQKDVRNLKLKP